MHRHAFPLCIGHLAPFQCHRSISISKGGDQEGSLCAPFLTAEMIGFISSLTEISASGESDGGGRAFTDPRTPVSTSTVTVLDSCDAGHFLPHTHMGGGWYNAKQKLLRYLVPAFDRA